MGLILQRNAAEGILQGEAFVQAPARTCRAGRGPLGKLLLKSRLYNDVV